MFEYPENYYQKTEEQRHEEILEAIKNKNKEVIIEKEIVYESDYLKAFARGYYMGQNQKKYETVLQSEIKFAKEKLEQTIKQLECNIENTCKNKSKVEVMK